MGAIVYPTGRMPRAKARASLEPLREVIRDAGLRSTGPRVAVLEHLQTTKVPLSHGELVEVLAHHGYARAKVQYAELLVAKGRQDEARNLMRELIADDQHSPRFQRVRDKAWIRRAKKLV